MVVTAIRRGTARFANMLATPLIPADYLDLLDPLRVSAPLRARVVDVRRETEEAATVVLRVGAGWSGHIPGQWVRIGVDVDGVRHWRAYSLTSRPTTDRLVSVTVEVVPDGRVSSYLVHQARPGLLVHLDQATGDFVLPEIRPRLSLFVSAGSGITPVMGMLRSGLHELDDVVVLHSARNPRDVIFGEELRRLGKGGHLRLIERHTGVDGRLTASQLMGLVPDWAEREAWVCGPSGLIDAFEGHWTAHGVSHRLHVERFRPPRIDVDGGGGIVTFDRSGVTVSTDATSPLLDAGEEAGVLLPSGCRMGICFGCVTPLTEGAVRDIRTGGLTVADGGGPVLVQTCVSTAAGPCHLDA